jgi:SAM-dependent methyltransferase
VKTVVNENSDIYYSTQYWNDLPQVLAYMCENITGDKSKWWVQDFSERFAQQQFELGLFINCGNGWVEREFIDKGIVKDVIAFDYSMDLLREANDQKGDRSIKYFQADINKVEFKNNCFDLIVNVAAMHHVQYINRVSFRLAKALKLDGFFINFDYIGPQRNQYSLVNWVLIHLFNLTLPKFLRKPNLRYPHLPTMLQSDPTEAIHSNLIISSISRYFDIIERHDTGGGIAYEILTNNPNLRQIQEKILNFYIKRILKYDKLMTSIKIVPPFFSYFLAKPNKDFLTNTKIIRYYQQRENKREKKAMTRGNIYSLRDFLLMAYWKIEMEFNKRPD